MIASLLSLTATPQSDSIIISRERYVQWAAKRSLADDFIRERAWDFARAHNIMLDLKALNVEADTICMRS